jgi:hypothetical protein
MVGLRKYAKYPALLVLWILSSYVLTSMVNNGKIALPNKWLDYPKPYTIVLSDLANNPDITLTDIEILADGRLRATTATPQIEIRGLKNHLSEIRSISYKWKMPPEEGWRTRIFFAYPDGTYNEWRQTADRINKGDRETLIVVSQWLDTNSIDKIRLDIVDREGIVLEIAEIVFNSQYSFDIWLFVLIILLFAAIEFISSLLQYRKK